MKENTLEYIILKLKELVVKEVFEEKKRGVFYVPRSVAYKELAEILEKIRKGEYE